MTAGTLGKHFFGVVMKRLSVVETNEDTSNQHEFNGTAQLRALFGDDDRRSIAAKFLWIDDDETQHQEAGFVSWYDARRAHPRRTEYRLYYPTNVVTKRAKAGDVLFIAATTNRQALVVVTPSDSTVQAQLSWLFGLPNQADYGFVVADAATTAQRPVGYVEEVILGLLGIETATPTDTYDALIKPFGHAFPATRVLSALARKTADASPIDDPDGALLAYMSQEELIFRALEKVIVSQRLATGFGEDVDDFLQFSLSVQNRRKSRAGHALGNHVEAILQAHAIAHKREATTEKRNGPDFLFPSETAYHDLEFSAKSLRMLAVKTSCKDRWRQIMAEADRIERKHLLTLEPGISTTQTAEMVGAQVQLVIPKGIFASYKIAQQAELLNFADFINLVR
jgi:hypothetical protein